MFRPELAGVEDVGFHEKINNCLSECEMDNFMPLVQNIMLTGGTTMFPGLSSRLTRELSDVLSQTRYRGDKTRVAKTGLLIHDPPRRKHAVFIGASFLAKCAPEDQWISRAAW